MLGRRARHMHALLPTLSRGLWRLLLSLAAIVALLLLGRLLWADLHAWRAARVEAPRVVEAQASLRERLRALAHDIDRRRPRLEAVTAEGLSRRIDELEREIAARQQEARPLRGLGPILAGQGVAGPRLRALELDAEIALLAYERDRMRQGLAWLKARQSAQQRRAGLEGLRLRHVERYTQWRSANDALDAFERMHPLRSRVPGTDEWLRRQALDAQRDAALQAVRQADADYRRERALLDAQPPAPPPPVMGVPDAEIDRALQPLDEAAAELRRLGQSSWIGRAWQPVREVLPTALLILLAAVATPVLVKAFFYFVLAPAAARRPPLRILPGSGGALAIDDGRSAVSCAIRLQPADELLLHADYLQSSAITGASTATQWLLNARFPWTSLSARMVALTRIRCEAPASFVVSSRHDPLAEVAVLVLPAGSAVVMQPQHLVGVVQSRGTPLRISAHWRLGSLHAWLTLQLRYLALHGPARLIVQGRRGVRVEAADGGRAISQDATIAFSANVAYATRRCETFVAYLIGRQSLLNDRFGDAGDRGSFVYAEVPRTEGASGVTGRGLQGLTDTLLKVFGV